MKKIITILLLVLTLFLTFACGNTAKSENNIINNNEATETKVVETNETINEKTVVSEKLYNRGKISKDEILFPLGAPIENSPAFTGTPYIQNLIPLEDVYNFPESNEVSFGPGARSNWHRHGGAKGCTFAHLAANSNPERPGVTWGDRLSEESFNKLNEELKKLDTNDKNDELKISKDAIISNSENANIITEDNNQPTSKTLVVYYSAQNHTKRVAEQIANKTGADIFEVVPESIYSEADLDWTDKSSRVSKEHDDKTLRDIKLTNINVPNWNDYDTVYLGYPIWWGDAAWPINNFVKGNDFTGKKVIPFCTSTSSGVGRSDKLLKEMTNTGDWSNGHRFYQGVSEDEVIKWVESLN